MVKKMIDTQITYGRTKEGIGYAKYKDHLGRKIELLSRPYKGLVVVVDGKIYQPGEKVPQSRTISYGESSFFTPEQMQVNEYVYLWTKVAGWLGNQQLINRVNRS
jgi:hypothetical protein